jgi:hypothetical protein
VTTDERLQLIEEKHLALAESVQLLTADMRASERKAARLDARERRARTALLAGVAAYMQALAEEDDEAPEDEV